jgi:iron complex outermembrane receptor protein
MRFRSGLQRLGLAGVGTIWAAPFAAAQPPAQPDAIEEIVVVAQKREQSEQDVGIAVTAFSAASLRERGIDQPDDLAELIPNVNLQNTGGGGAPVVIVRGVGLQSFRINDSPTTAFYVDDVYQTSVASAEWTMFDLDHVEVLKGPQGGLYGRNAIGAAVQVISKHPDPDEDKNGYVSLGYADYDRAEAEAAASFPVADRVAVRIAGRLVESSGSPYRSITGGFEQGEDDRNALRFSVRAEPSDNVSFTANVHGGSNDSQLPPLRTVGVYANIGTFAPAAPTVSRALVAGLNGVPNTLCPSILQGRGSDPATCATATGVTPAAYGLQPDDVRASVSAFRGFEASDWSGAVFDAQWTRGNYRWQSITAVDSIDYRRFQDFDGTPLLHLHIDYNTDIDARSEELRVFYEGSDKLSWVAGFNYAQDDLTEDSPLFGAQGVLPLIFNVPGLGGATFSPQHYDQNTDTWAVFGHAEWRFAEPWNLVTELRYTDSSQTFLGGDRLGFPSGLTVPFVATNDSADFDAWSGKVGIEWTLNDSLLVYGSVARGFKTGGFFGGFATSAAQLLPFDSETIDSIETGFKSDWLDGRLRLNASVYHYDRKDVQQNAGDPTSPIQIKRIQNIGDVDTDGFEAELTWRATEQLSLALGVGTTDAEVTKSSFIQASSLPLLPDTPIQGTNLPNYAKRSANFVGRYDGAFGAGLEYFVQLEGRYQSDQDLSVITQPIERPVFEEPGYSLWNVRFGFGSRDRTWQAQLFVEYAADEDYRVLARNDGAFGIHELYGLPRTWGVSYQYRWD